MKKIIVLVLSVFLLGVVMGQQVINGVYQGSPRSFMYLPSTVTNTSWVRPSRAEDGNFNSQINQGAVTTGQFSHRFITTADSTVSPSNDPCFRVGSGSSYNNKPVLASAWNSDLYPQTYVDTVIQMGGHSGVTNRGKYAQQMLYSFVPDLENPVLLLQFAFVTEGVYHESHAPRNPGVEFALLAHGTNNYLPLGNYNSTHPYSQFWFGTPVNNINGTPDPHNTPLPASVAPQAVPKSPNCQCSSGISEVFTFPYTIVAFNLTEQALNHQAVDFRVREWSCNANVHWSYCYFTAKMIPAELQVKYCGGDVLELQMPWGFDEATYNWYNGVDSATTTNSDAFWFDPTEETSVVLHGSTKYRPKLRPDPTKPYYRCVVKSYTNVPFVYQATVNYYDLKPSFTVEEKAWTSGKNCDYGVVLHNTSQIGIIRPNGHGGVDTTWQNLEANPEQCTWDFGDGTPEVHGFQPAHTYAQPGTYTIKLHITDFERVCVSADVEETVEILPEFMEKQYATDTVTTCENKLPYYYKPEIFGMDNVQSKWDLNAVGDRQVNYSLALPQYHIRAWNGCDSIVKVRFDVLTPTVNIQQIGDFCDSASTMLYANANYVREESVRYEWTFMDSVMGTTNELNARCDGIYSVSIVDMSTGCEAATSYKIDPCVPNIFLPNCITPTRSVNEGPAQNDYLYLDDFVQRFISDVKFMVYARDGEQVYYYEGTKNPSGVFEPAIPFTDLPSEMNGRLVLWDGKVGGRVVAGTYTYALWIVSGGQTYLYKGRLMVM